MVGPLRFGATAVRVRFLEVSREQDLVVVRRLIGCAVDARLRGWVAIIESSSIPEIRSSATFAGERGLAFAGPLTLLAQSALPEVREGAQKILGRPAPLVLGRHTFDWTRPVVMGIVNVTPDSFSDGGQFLATEAAIEHGLRLVQEGADILDVGGESTRPKGQAYGEGARSVPAEEEIARVVPVIRALRARTVVPISVDTRKAAVAKAAIEAGAEIVNDVSGLLHDSSMAALVRSASVALVLMHTPADIERLSHEQSSQDILGDVQEGLYAAIAKADGIRLLVDPGIGFGKTAGQNLYLLRHLRSLKALGLPMMVGASRKASIARAAAGDGPVLPPNERLGASVGAAVSAFLKGAHLFRVHDVKETVYALRVAAAIDEAQDAGAAF
jgi:dihydropteroate synthase